MSGIYGNSAEDRYRERELDRYLDSQRDEESDIFDEADEAFEAERDNQ